MGGALRIERDGLVLRVTLAKPERRNAFDAELIAELLRRRRRRLAARVRRPDLRREPRGCNAPLPDAPGDRPLRGTGRGADPRLRARRRKRRRRLPRRRDRTRRLRLRFLGGPPRHRSGRHLALRAPADRAGRCAPLLPDRGALRIGLVHEVTADLDTAVEQAVENLLAGGPEAVRAAKRLVGDAPGAPEVAERAARLRSGAEGQEGLRAFLEKRPAAWRSGSSS